VVAAGIVVVVAVIKKSPVVKHLYFQFGVGLAAVFV
jgi:hypothetical protein